MITDNLIEKGNRMEIKMVIFKIFRIIGIVFVLTLFYFYFTQENYIYYPQKITKNYSDGVTKSNKNAEDVIIETDGKIKIHGWYIRQNTTTKSPLLIYFGGNSEEVSYLVNEGKFEGYSLLIMNYRGYGLSEGKPNEKNILGDALKIYDYAIKRNDVDKSNIIIMGRSLGTGVATFLSSKRICKAVILTSPYDSMTSVAQEKMPFLPIELISRNKYKSILLASQIKYPLLAIVGNEDSTIPNWHSKKLLDSWGGQTKYMILEKEDHNSIMESNLYWKTINEFLKEVNQ